jgi:hypothetical protein
MNRVFFLFALLVGSQLNAFAACETDRFGVVYCGRGDCAKDRTGAVFCSKYLFGDARLDEHGNVVCGKGQCVESVKFPDFYCSTIESGGAKRNRMGEVKCYGGCEKASALMCENEAGR